MDGSAVEVLLDGLAGLIEPIGIALDPVAGKVYWSDAGPNNIQRANLDGSAVEDLVPFAGNGRAIALDLVARKMYWTNTSGNSVRRSNLDGTIVEHVLTGLAQPRGIALDPTPTDLCKSNLSCDDAEPCTIDVCDVDVCTFPTRLYGDANVDGVGNITDVICSARVIFQNATLCGAHQVSPDKIDIAPSIDCGDGLLNIVDLVIHARAAFQGVVDECCGG